MKKIFSIISLLLFTLSSILTLVDIQKWASVGMAVINGLWLAFTFAVVLYAIFKKSLTTWILVAMIVGIQVGLHFHDTAMNLQVLSKIFLKLIKTVIAPILFGTLVVGIAGHSNLKQLGRMGWKSLLYFEVVTTLALCIGLLAINISQAGSNLHIPERLIHALPQSPEKQMQEKMIGILDSATLPIPRDYFAICLMRHPKAGKIMCLIFSLKTLQNRLPTVKYYP